MGQYKVLIARPKIFSQLPGNKASATFTWKVFHALKMIFLKVDDSCLNTLDTMTKGTKQFSNPYVLSSAFTVLQMLQPWAFGLLSHLVALVLVSNYYAYV